MEPSNQTGLANTNVGTTATAASSSRTPKNRETASLSKRQLLEWLLLNGTKWIQAYDDDGQRFRAYKVAEIPRFLEEPLKVELAFDISADHQPPIGEAIVARIAPRPRRDSSLRNGTECQCRRVDRGGEEA